MRLRMQIFLCPSRARIPEARVSGTTGGPKDPTSRELSWERVPILVFLYPRGNCGPAVLISGGNVVGLILFPAVSMEEFFYERKWESYVNREPCT